MPTARKPAPSGLAKLKAAAKTVGLDLVKKGKGYVLVDATTGTLVADDWAGTDGLTLDQIETALKS